MTAIGTVPGSCQPGVPAFVSKHGMPVASGRPGHGAGRAVPGLYWAKNVPGLRPNGGPHYLDIYSCISLWHFPFFLYHLLAK
jgi:hypothetical protein